MKEDLKKIMLMGLGAMSMSSEKAKELKDELLKKGQELYDKGVIANEELKHNLKEVMKENVTVVTETTKVDKDSIINSLDELSEDDKKEILNKLQKNK